VGDENLVEDIVIEGKVVGSIAWLEKGVDIQEKGDFGGIVVGDEREKVSDVGLGIKGCDGSLSMAGGETGWWCDNERR
jgi:hypothetical protein